MPSTDRACTWRTVTAALVGAAALTVSALVAPTANANQGHGDNHGRGHGARHGYLALGDSVPFGYRPPAVAPDYRDARTFVGYPEVLAGRRGLRLANASCPGETTDSMIDATAQSNGCENSLGSPLGYRTAFPLHVAYAGSQLDYAVGYLRSHPRTRLVSLTVGANDLFLCQKTTADRCTGSDFGVLTTQVEQNVRTILSTLRHRAHYRHRIAVVSYYSLDYRDPVQTAVISALNAAVARAAAADDAVVADGFAAMRQAAAVAGGDTCAAELVIALPTGGCDVHPTLAGHQALAGALARVAGHRHHHHHHHH